MYTQQKPSWVTIRKKLTIFLEERRKKTCYKRRVGLSFLVPSPGVGDLVPAPSLLLMQSTMGSKKGGNNHSLLFKKKKCVSTTLTLPAQQVGKFFIVGSLPQHLALAFLIIDAN